jgi:hypothetical protein
MIGVATVAVTAVAVGLVVIEAALAVLTAAMTDGAVAVAVVLIALVAKTLPLGLTDKVPFFELSRIAGLNLKQTGVQAIAFK